MRKDKKNIQRKQKLETKIGKKDKERISEIYRKQETTQPSECYVYCSQEHQIRDCNTDRNLFVR